MSSEIATIDTGGRAEVASAPDNLFGGTEPAEIVQKAVAIADQLGPIIKQKGLTSRIGDKDYLRAEAWQLAGGLMGVSASTLWTRPIPADWHPEKPGDRPIGWEAKVEIRTLSGLVVSSGESSCMRDESKWSHADDYAVRSMAQTRALGKAYRQGFGYVATLMGYEATPAEEMDGIVNAPAQTSRGSQGSSGGSQGLSCPACGSSVYDNRADIASGKRSEKYPAFKCSNRSCEGVDSDGQMVTDGKQGEPWVTWSHSYFDGGGSSGSLDSDELLEVQAHIDTGAVTEAAVLSIARRLAKDAGEGQPTSLLEIDQLPEEVRVAVVEAVAEKIGGGE